MTAASRVTFEDDFVGAKLNATDGRVYSSGAVWTVSAVAGSPTISVQASQSNAPGIVRVQTDSATGDDALAILGHTFLLPINQIVECEFRIRLERANDIDFQVGLFSASPVPGAAGRYISYNSGIGTFRSISRVSSSSNTITTGVAGDTDWHRFKLISAPGDLTGTSELARCNFYDEDGAMLGAIHHPTNTTLGSTPVFFGVAIQTLLSGSAHVDLDLVRFRTVELAR